MAGRITISRGGRFLRRGYGGRLGGAKIFRFRPSGWGTNLRGRFIRR